MFNLCILYLYTVYFLFLHLFLRHRQSNVGAVALLTLKIPIIFFSTIIFTRNLILAVFGTVIAFNYVITNMEDEMYET